MIAGGLNLLPITMPLILRGWRMISDYGPDPAGLFSVSALLIAGIGGVLIFGAMQMLRLQNYGLCVATSILAMTAPPGLLLGLPLGIWSLVLLTRPEVRRAFDRNRRPMEEQKENARPHFSRTAILGAAWALCFILASWFLTATEPSGSRPEKPIWEMILNFTLLPLGITAPIGATVLGWMSISRIRRSAGRIHGMPLAVLTALLFPMLALDVLIVWLSMGVKLGFGEAVFLCVPIDGFLIWVVWRSLQPPGSTFARRFGWLPAAGSMALVAVICAGMFVKVMVNKSVRARANLEKQLKEDIAELLAEKRITYSRMHFEYSPVLPRALVTFMRLENWRNRTNGEPLSATSGLHLAFDTPGVCVVSGRGDLSDIQRTLFVPDAKALSWPHRVGPTEDDQLGQSGLKPQTGFAATLPDGSFVELVSIMYGSSARRSPGQTNSIDFWNPDGTRLDHDLGWSFGPSNLGSRRDPALDYRQFVVRWGGPDENNPRLMGWQIDDNPQDSVDGQFTVSPKGESAENWIGLGQGFPRGEKTAKLRFALASGPYMTGPGSNMLWSSSGTTPFGSYSIGKIFDHNGNAAVTLTHNLKGCDYRLRVTVDRFPKPKSRLGGFIWEWQEEFRRRERYPAIEGRVVKGGASNQTFEFPGVPAKEAMSRLPRIDFEVRPVRWVEFENVALNPGEKTPVQIRAGNGSGESSSKNASAIVIDRDKFSELYPAVWFSPATGEVVPIDIGAERPPQEKYEIWIEPRDPEFRIGKSATNNVGKEPGFAPVGKGSKIFEETRNWQAQTVEEDLAKLMRGSNGGEQPVFYCQGKTSACLIMITQWEPKSQIIGFRWKRLGVEGWDAADPVSREQRSAAAGAAEHRRVIEVESVILEAPGETWISLTPASYDRDKLAADKRFKVFRGPRVTTLEGREATIQLFDPKPNPEPNGNPAGFTQQTVSIIPRLDGDGIVFSVKGHFTKVDDVWVSPSQLTEDKGRVAWGSPMVYGLSEATNVPAKVLVLTLRPIIEVVPTGRTAQESGSSHGPPVFGAVTERVLDAPGIALLDIEAGQVKSVSPSKAEAESGVSRAAEFPEHQTWGVMAFVRDGNWELYTSELFAELERGSWDGVSAAELAKALDSKLLPSIGIPFARRNEGARTRYKIFDRDDALPVDFGFRTSTGRTGVLQIVSFTEQSHPPHQMRIRYKFIQALK
jgi:uncharacterized membrane-anchored protein YhcB (DUF1043 family)